MPIDSAFRGKQSGVMNLRSHFLLAMVLMLVTCPSVKPQQTGDHTLYGDLSVDESEVAGVKPLTFDVILYSEANILVARQPASSNGRYRFNNLPMGLYYIAIEVEGSEVARVSADLRSPLLKDVRRDIALQWHMPAKSTKAGVLSVDAYTRSAPNEKIFRLATDATRKKNFAKAAALFNQVVAGDARDFEAWAALADVHFMQKNFAAAENEYLRAIDTRPGYFMALLNFGRLEITLKKYDVAVEALKRAVTARPDSADANYFLGDSYLRLKKGSTAVRYLNEAVRLDPDGMAEVHLRLATLYHAAGLREKAAAEYEAFLKKRPAYRDRKRLERYIAENRRR
jgi:tetratricopeptide (TPR) repeat protein